MVKAECILSSRLRRSLINVNSKYVFVRVSPQGPIDMTTCNSISFKDPVINKPRVHYLCYQIIQNETLQIHWWVNDNNKNITTWYILNFHTKIDSNALIKQVDFRDGEGGYVPPI